MFLAPGLLAASAMGTGVGESTYPVFGSVKWNKTYQAAEAAPLRPGDLFHGHLLFVVMRTDELARIVFLCAFGAVRSPWPLRRSRSPCSPGWRSPHRSRRGRSPAGDTSFAVVFRFGMIPLFLFSGTFFPVTQLPAWLRPVAYLTPLWHGVALCRALCLGRGQRPGRAAARRLPGRAGRRRALGRGPHLPKAAVCLASPCACSRRPGCWPGRACGSGRGSLHLAERHARVYRRTWLVFVSGVVEPLFYLLSIGVGLGKLVGTVPARRPAHPVPGVRRARPAGQRRR